MTYFINVVSYADSILHNFFYLASFSLSISLVFPLLLFVSVSWTNASSCVDIRARRFLSSALVSRTYSARPFFNLFLFPFSLYLTPLLPSYTAPSDFFPTFFFRSRVPCGGIFALFYFCRPSSSFFLLVRRLRRSLSVSFAPPLPLLYLFPGILPYFRDVATADLDTSSRFSTHIYVCINARSLIFLDLPFSRVRRERAPAIRRTRYIVISRFPFRMYARCLIRDPFYFVSILSSFVAQSAFLGHLFPFSYHSSSPFARFSLPIPQIPNHFVTSPMGDPWKYDTLDSLPLPTLIRHAARERRTARLSDPANVAR